MRLTRHTAGRLAALTLAAGGLVAVPATDAVAGGYHNDGAAPGGTRVTGIHPDGTRVTGGYHPDGTRVTGGYHHDGVLAA